MRNLLIAALCIVSHLSWSQSEDYIVVEPFAVDSIRIDSSMLVHSLTIRPRTKWGFSIMTNTEYEDFMNRAIDTMLVKGGNVLKVLEYSNSSSQWGGRSIWMNVEIYKVRDNAFYDLYIKNEEVKKKHKKRFENLSWLRKKTVTKYEDGWYEENRFKAFRSIPRDSTIGKYLEVGVSGGMDILLALNLHVNTELYFLNTSIAKISLSNKAGVMIVPIGEYYISYTSPGIKLALPIKNIWLTATYGKEFLRYHVNDENYTGIKTDVIDKRIDFGLKFYKSKKHSIEVYYPLRLDDEVIAWWTGGLVMSLNYRI